MDNVIDNLQIEIESSSTSASDNIKKLITSIRKLDKIGQGTGLASLNKNLKKFSDLDFSKVSRRLSKISNNLTNIARLRDVLKDAPLTDPIETIGKTVRKKANKKAGTVLGDEEFNVDVPHIDDTVEKLKPIKEAVNETTESFQQVKIAGTDSMAEITAAIDKCNRVYDLMVQKTIYLRREYEKTTEKFGAENIKTINAELAFRNAEQGAEAYKAKINDLIKLRDRANKGKFTLGLEGFGQSLKRIALYRLVRTLISQVSNAVKEGIKNLVQYSEEANDTMSKLKSSTTQLKNAFGTALMPVLSAGMPLITDLCDLLSNLLNNFAAVSSAISGKSTYSKAIKNNLDYAESLKKVQTATLGIDELNIIGDNSSESDTSAMFEEVQLSAGEVAASIAKITTLGAAIAGLLVIFKGTEIKSFFSTMKKGLGDITGKMNGISKWKKGATALALLAAGGIAVFNAFESASLGTKSWGEALLVAIPIIVAVGFAMTKMLGPVGLVLTALVAVGTAIAGVVSAQTKLAKDKAMEKFWKTQGVAISEVNKLLSNYFKGLGIDEQQEWNETLEETNDKLINAVRNYDNLWHTISQSNKLDSSNIEKLSAAFKELADAAMAINKAAIGSLMSSIKTGIEMNITPELTKNLNGLISSLGTAQDLLNAQVSGINVEYQKLLNEITSSGGNITEEQKNKLNDLRSEINKFTLSDNTSSELWATNVKEAIEKGIKAGTDEESIKKNIGNLTSQRDSYLETIKTNYASSVSTLKQLIEIDKKQFNGALGFKESDLDILEKNYKGQVDTVNKQYNEVFDKIIASFQGNMIKESEIGNSGDFWKDFKWGFLKGISLGFYESGDEKALKEQKEFLEWLKGQKGYATGGFPEDDSLIYVNPYEIVGSMSNGKNVVANNEQIIEGIKQGVYEATVAANQNNNNSDGGDFEFKIYLDGKQITASVEKYQKKKAVGKSIYAGGVLNGV